MLVTTNALGTVMNLLSMLDSSASFIVALSLLGLALLVLLHEPANRNAVRLLRALRKEGRGK